jgi:hypothetical protein
VILRDIGRELDIKISRKLVSVCFPRGFFQPTLPFTTAC